MPGRPPKRPAEAGDPATTDADTAAAAAAVAAGHGKVKLPRLDKGGQEDFSSVVKNRLSSYTRTGQACDRCKVRKIRCDALPEGCSHCVNQNLDCFVTDRVTGRTERRGYLQELEREKTDMMNHIRDLEKLLENNGIEVKPWTWAPYGMAYPPPGVTYDHVGNAVEDPAEKDAWTKVGSVWVKNYNFKPPASRSFPRSSLESRPVHNHIGVGGDSALLSSIKGTRLSILGTTIDVTSFDAPDMDEPVPDAKISQPLYNKSLQSFLQSCMNINPPVNIELPSRSDAFTYSEWYFLMIWPFLPWVEPFLCLSVLAADHLSKLTRMYDEPDFEPEVPDLVMVHMVFATIYFQYGVRNWEQQESRSQLNELSNKHYHFALSKMYDLASAQSVAAVQAMAMISAHSRAFPKPGCGSMVTNFAFHCAIDLNLHRAAKAPGETTNLENEIRKRTWWTILTVYVTLNGRLGRPMPINVEEYDVDFPEPIADEALTPEGVDTSVTTPCNYHVGLAGFKIVPLFMEMYSNIYSVKRDPKNYADVVNALEEQLQLWKDSLPENLQLNLAGQTEHEGKMYALYIQMYALEFRLCLRHPSVAMTSDRKMLLENARICEETAAHMLKATKCILKLKSLDTTWYQIAVYGAAIFTTLVAHWERRFETTPNQIANIRSDMRDWMEIINATVSLIGTGSGISNEINLIIERTISWIEHDSKQKEGSLPHTIKPDPADSSPFQLSAQPQSTQALAASAAETAAKAFYAESANQNGNTPYPSLAYAEQPGNNSLAANAAFEANNAYSYTPAVQATGADETSAETNPLIAFASQATQHVADPTGSAAAAELLWRQSASQGNTWHDWTAAMADSQDRYSANALLTLGGGPRDPNAVSEAATVAEMAAVTAAPVGQWPLLLFDGPGGGGQ
ncbi:Protein SIP4 [Colletotrichum gloeosporioides]|uniref:Protein SIP4 n=1 Tax=Colletotrichum gloeosporioides TaxID=474922 RepID=A0A8H4C7Z3_COLGL|nr:Protein SIP4 [Colletotrichum gloeosporioides]KAF3799061.1 Protein SIP4 [Colletotrichum gloeosporioides]